LIIHFCCSAALGAPPTVDVIRRCDL